MRHPQRVSICLAVLALALGCASVEGRRLYASGTEALDHGDSARAVVDLERAAALLPEASPVQNHLGLAYLQDGRAADAEAAFRRAIELDCGNDAAQHNLRAAEAGRFRSPEARASSGGPENSHVP